MTRIYIAARYSRLPEVQALAAHLREYGYIVDARWIAGENRALDDDILDDSNVLFAFECAEHDYDDLSASDALIVLTDPPYTAKRGGMHVEFGMALAWSIPTVVIGPVENIFYTMADRILPATATVTDVLDALKPMKEGTWLDT